MCNTSLRILVEKGWTRWRTMFFLPKNVSWKTKEEETFALDCGSQKLFLNVFVEGLLRWKSILTQSKSRADVFKFFPWVIDKIVNLIEAHSSFGSLPDFI